MTIDILAISVLATFYFFCAWAVIRDSSACWLCGAREQGDFGCPRCKRDGRGE